MVNLITWLTVHPKTAFKALIGLFIGFLMAFSVHTYKQNEILSERLEAAQNNIEAYQGSIEESWQANNVLKLDIAELKSQNDKLLNNLDSVRKELKIKTKQVNTAATQTQHLSVIGKKEIDKEIIEILKDTIYKDSIKYNDLTTVHYSIGKDTICIALDVENTQYLYIYKDRQYKNKKNFFQRLFTLDFKKVNKYKYQIVNTNDLLDTSDVRIVEKN